jgi:hypothetical protein
MAEQRIETSVEIGAPPSRVWEVLTDQQSMGAWNSFIRSMAGPLKEGGRLLIEIAPPKQRTMTFRPTVLRVVPERELRWLGTLLIPGLFNGEHYFLLEPIGQAGTHFTQGERFTGLLVSPFEKRGMLKATQQGFDAMNAALKARAEAQALA